MKLFSMFIVVFLAYLISSRNPMLAVIIFIVIGYAKVSKGQKSKTKQQLDELKNLNKNLLHIQNAILYLSRMYEKSETPDLDLLGDMEELGEFDHLSPEFSA